jgi:hypothetical protein
MGGARSLGNVRGWMHERNASGRGKRIHATDDIAAAPLSHEDREALPDEVAPHGTVKGLAQVDVCAHPTSYISSP